MQHDRFARKATRVNQQKGEEEMNGHHDIKIGTLTPGGANTANYLRQIMPYGFESFALTLDKGMDSTALVKLADEVKATLVGSDAVISCLGVYGNPLEYDTDAAVTREGLEAAIDHARDFDCDLVSSFTGRLVDTPIHKCLSRYHDVWEPLVKRAADRGVRIAFENCAAGGDWNHGTWNIAHNPLAWELLFNTLDAPNLGLEWEPCHQMCQLIDPMPQIRKWGSKFFHLHGKDASVFWDVVKEHGVIAALDKETAAELGVRPIPGFAFHRTPGFGDSNWTAIISELRRVGFSGSIDIEGWHDPVYRGDLEMTGQVAGLNYLKLCRGGDFVPNPA